MREVRKELNFLKYEIQRQKGLLNSLDRQLKRVHGERITYISSKADGARIRKIDEVRLREECGLDDWDLGSPNILKSLRDQQAAYIQEKRDRAAHLRHKLDTQIPITPWGVAFALIKIWYRRIRT
ncbi:MAG: hypothetical protein OXH93_12795 [Caldilineaceae bacterium]|nr:hypothetical protein [Caldilineaceae bacterium]